jgi:hypothetical protein
MAKPVKRNRKSRIPSPRSSFKGPCGNSGRELGAPTVEIAGGKPARTLVVPRRARNSAHLSLHFPGSLSPLPSLPQVSHNTFVPVRNRVGDVIGARRVRGVVYEQ